MCADSLLCLVGEGGKLFINPTSRLAVKATCSTKGNSDCSGLEYQWYVRPESEEIKGYKKLSNYKLLSPDDMSVEIADMENTDYGVGCKTNSRSTGPPIVCEADLAISTTFFSTFPKQVYVVELNATNSQDAAGEYFLTSMALIF